jgi:hypothetical protein
VDANGAYSRKQAVRLTGFLADQEVTWFEEPVSSDDLAGLSPVRAQVACDVAAHLTDSGEAARVRLRELVTKLSRRGPRGHQRRGVRGRAQSAAQVSGRLRPGNAGANTASDHIVVLDQALAQIPDTHQHGSDILVRTDSAGSAKAFLAHVRDVRKRGIRTFFSVGYAITEPVRRAIRALPERLWHPALDQDGTLRDGAEVAELTGMVDVDGYPAGTRIIVRRERPHPGAQLSLFDQDAGVRHQVFLTDTPYSGGGSAQFLEARHRGHTCIEDHIRCGKSTGFGRFPSRDFGVNAVWLELSLAAIDLLAWTRVLLLDGDLATAEPKKLRYRLLQVAARLTHGGRRLRLRILATWPWRQELARAFHRLAALPRPAG